MIKHYLKIAFRNMRKYKTQSLIGIFGLAFGLACFVPALYWLRYETSYDSFYPDAERIYRIYAVEKQSGKVNELVPEILERKLHEHYASTEISTVFFSESHNCIANEMSHIRLNILNTDSSFFRVFPQEVVSGDIRQPLQILNNIVLSETVAVRLFGDVEKAIGQQIQNTLFSFLPPYTVTAVVKDPPPNSNLSFDALLFSDLRRAFSNRPEEMQWANSYVQLYVKFHPHTDIKTLAGQLRDFTTRMDADINFEVSMLPISDVRHRLNADAPFTLNFTRLFVASGILLIFSTLYNFLNLYLNLFRQRIRELRQRAIHGAKGKHLIVQMIFELTCAMLPALTLAYCFVFLTYPVFSKLLNITIKISQLTNLFVICGIAVIAIILLFVFIPFRQLSYKAVRRLSERKTIRNPILRHTAVTLQLIVSVAFIIVALVVMMQMRFISRKDLGFDSSKIIQLSGLPLAMQRDVRTVLIQELEAIPQIENISATFFEPRYSADERLSVSQVEWPGKAPNENPDFSYILTDSRFPETIGLKILMGKWFEEGEVQKIALNEEAVRIMGLSNPVGTIIHVPPTTSGDIERFEVAGVVNDFHSLSFRSSIRPIIFLQDPSNDSPYVGDNILYISVVSGQMQEAMRRISAILPAIDPSYTNILLTPLDELYDSFNRSEQVGLKLFSVLASVCLLISLFGIYAVATASTQRRRKEIAIRKVFGAEVRDIVRIFFREYTMQVIIAGVIALPIAYYAMYQWLQGYAYRTSIPLWLLTGVIVAIAVVVLLTVLRQIWKAANENPAEVVKN